MIKQLLFSLFAFFSLLVPSVAQQIKPLAAMIANAKSAGVRFERAEPLQLDKTGDNDANLSEIVRTATLLSTDSDELNTLFEANNPAIELVLPYKNSVLHLELLQNQTLTDDFSVVTSEGATVAYEAGRYYRGIVKGDNSSVVAVSLFRNELIGVISTSREGNIVLGKLEIEDNETDYILYNDADLLAPHTFECGTKEPEDYGTKMREYLSETTSGALRGGNPIRIFVEGDYKLFQAKGTTSETTNFMTAVFNNVSTLYQNEQITMQMSQFYIWTAQDNYATNNSNTALNQFASNRTTFNGDLAHLAAVGGVNQGGIAYVDVLCFPGYQYGYSNIKAAYSVVPTYSWTIEVMTHEIGHGVGSPHTHSCNWTGGALDNCYTTEGGCAKGPAPTNGGTIMSYCHITNYGINFSNGFGTQPGTLIRNRAAAASCLQAASTTTCGVVSGVQISNITDKTASIAWFGGTGASSYVVQYRVIGTTAWASLVSSTTTLSLSNLTSDKSYEIQIQTICGNTNSAFAGGTIFKTTTTIGTPPPPPPPPPTSTCDKPNAPTFSNVKSNAASITWNTATGAKTYNFQWKITGASQWKTASFNTTSCFLSSLQPNKQYSIRVQSACTSGTSSYSSVAKFYTLASTTGKIIQKGEASNAASLVEAGNFGQTPTMRIQPNPAHDWLLVQFKNIAKESVPSLLELYDLQGRKQDNLWRKGDVITLDVSNLPKGMYLIRAVVEETVLTEKVVVE
ncbi:MAG: hypothetical protein RLZZ292_2344 [Bacteroidota bacterium]|jgi:hypothetical protein